MERKQEDEVDSKESRRKRGRECQSLADHEFLSLSLSLRRKILDHSICGNRKVDEWMVLMLWFNQASISFPFYSHPKFHFFVRNRTSHFHLHSFTSICIHYFHSLAPILSSLSLESHLPWNWIERVVVWTSVVLSFATKINIVCIHFCYHLALNFPIKICTFFLIFLEFYILLLK